MEARQRFSLTSLRKLQYHCMRDRQRFRNVVTDIAKLPVDEQVGVMARKDLEKETERPRYYSQFWLDVAAGRRVIGAGKSAEAEEEAEDEVESAPEPTSKAAKAPKGTATPSVVEAEPS